MDVVNCYLCDVPACVFEEPHTRMMGDREVTFLDRFYRCAECGEAFYVGEMTRESLLRATAVIRAEDGLLAPDDIVGLRKKYGLTQAQLERLIGAGPKTVVRWERGTVSQNKTADTLLRVLLDHPEVVASLKKQNGITQPARRRSSTTPVLKKAKNASAGRK